jgi:N-acetyl-alpha-D-muramate 1-phosphate uridylyltransferase
MSAPFSTAMVLAAGLGTRMKPLTDDRPKALVEVAGQPLIDHMLGRLSEAGVTTAVVNVHAFADRLEAHLLNRTEAPTILISDERSEVLETGGGLRLARPMLGEEPIFVANIDSVWRETGASLTHALKAAWDPERMDVLLALAPLDRTIGFDGLGDFYIAEDGALTFRGDAPSAPFAYMGLHITKPQIVDQGPKGAFSLALLWRDLASQKRLFGVVLEGDWMHVGDPVSRDQAEARLTQPPA